jgi:hypothetical protein
MNINNIRAHNVLKYAHLEFNGLPVQGLIAVSGRNESGKSTIGETICFALFGRTFSLRPEEITKIIRWGETRCRVLLDFTVGQAGEEREYRVERSLDDAGNQGATLTRIGQEEPQARGVAAVTAEVKRLAGFGYKEFIESFYLAQREIHTPHGHSEAVKSMAGLAPLERVDAQLAQEVKELTDNMINAERDMADVNDRLSELNIQPDYLHSLWADLSATGEQHREKSTRARLLRHVSDRCREALQMLKTETGPVLKAGINTSYQGWSAHAKRLDKCAQVLDSHCAQRDAASSTTESTATLKDFVQHLKEQLARFGQIMEGVGSYRARLTRLLKEPASDDAPKSQEASLPAKKAEFARRAEAAMHSRKRARVFAVISLILAIAVWMVWIILFPIVLGWQGYDVTLLCVAIALTIIFVLFMIRSRVMSTRIKRFRNESAALDRQIQETREEAAALDDLATMPLPNAVALLTNVRDEQIAAEAAQFESDSSVTLLDHDSLNEYRRLLTSVIARSEDDIEAARSHIANEAAELDRDVRELARTMAQLNQAIPVEQERRRTADHLQGIMQSLQGKIDETRDKIEIRNLARDVLEHGYQYVSRRFNHDIRSLVGKTLPLLTSNRYEHLQIDEALRVRVFSGQKHDFLNLDEISSGTQRQIMLAVRLALAQALVNTAVYGNQFIFLDEPFAFFDEQRMRDALKVLPTLSDNITQIWVIAQEFPEDAHFNLHIRCEHEMTNMKIDAA